MQLRNHLEKIHYFQTICAAGSFRQAALDLHLSQSSLTVAVKKLEASIGRSLLVRTKRGVRPTAEGTMLLGFASDLKAKVTDLEARLLAPTGTVAGHLRIGAYDSIAIYWLPEVLRHLKRLFPALSLSISVGSSAGIVRRVRAGDLDLGIVVAPDVDRRLRITELFRDAFSLFATPDIAKAAASRSGDAVVGIIGMFGARVDERTSLADALREAGVSLERNLEVESFEIAKALAEQGVGVAALPHRVAKQASGRGRSLVRLRHRPLNFGEHSVCLIASAETRDHELTALVSQEFVAKAVRSRAT